MVDRENTQHLVAVSVAVASIAIARQDADHVDGGVDSHEFQ